MGPPESGVAGPQGKNRPTLAPPVWVWDLGCSLAPWQGLLGGVFGNAWGQRPRAPWKHRRSMPGQERKQGPSSTLILLGLSPLTSPPSPTSAPAGADRVRQEPGARSKGTSQMGCNRPSTGSPGRGRASECEAREDGCPGHWKLTVQRAPIPGPSGLSGSVGPSPLVPLVPAG